VVLVSHSMALLRDICDRILLIEKGEVVYLGDPKEAIKRYLKQS